MLVVSVAATCPYQPLQVQRLPNLNVARTGHQVFCAGQEIIVIGGHTNGFVPTATAEYLAEGQWHLLPTAYSHDQGLAVQLSDSTIILAGGHEQPLGIGQTFSLELYNPATHTFEGYGCLQQKRCFAKGVELDSGHVVITGNWYAADGIELYDGSRQCLPTKGASQQRAMPYVLRTARDNAIIVGSVDNHGEPLDTIIADRVKGEPFSLPLLQQWHPQHSYTCYQRSDGFIGDMSAEHYAYLLPATNQRGQMAILHTEGEQFTLLPTVDTIPTSSQWGPINYFGGIVADRQRSRAYMVGKGCDDDHRLYVLSIEYEQRPAPLTLCHTEPLDSLPCYAPVLTADGHLLMAGGTADDSNFAPTDAALLLLVGPQQVAASPQDGCSSCWPWLAGGGVVVLLLAGLFYYRRRRKEADSSNTATQLNDHEDDEDSEHLISRINLLMEQEKLYLNSQLRLTDVADRLNTSSTYVSRCINTKIGYTFNQFVNTYRISHAQQLLRQQPDMKILTLSTASGFANETSFFRTFKALTGMTPKEWLASTEH